MATTVHATGTCLCGAVEISTQEMNLNVGACHCSSCRRWIGGPLLAVDGGTKVDLKGKDSLSIFDSSEWAERGFCKRCGSSLFYRLKHNNQHFIPVGLFGDDHRFHLDHQVFIDEKPEYYCFSQNTKNMTGAEVFAQAQSE